MSTLLTVTVLGLNGVAKGEVARPARVLVATGAIGVAYKGAFAPVSMTGIRTATLDLGAKRLPLTDSRAASVKDLPSAKPSAPAAAAPTPAPVKPLPAAAAVATPPKADAPKGQTPKQAAAFLKAAESRLADAVASGDPAAVEGASKRVASAQANLREANARAEKLGLTAAMVTAPTPAPKAPSIDDVLANLSPEALSLLLTKVSGLLAAR